MAGKESSSSNKKLPREGLPSKKSGLSPKPGTGNKPGSGGGGNLYEEASQIITEISKKGTSGGLRTIIYNNASSSTRRSDPRQMYALVSSTLKFRDLLTAVIKASGVLRTEKKFVCELWN